MQQIVRITKTFIKHLAGNAAMGDVTVPYSPGRVSLDDEWWTILSVRGDCINGSGYADCTLYLDSHRLPRVHLDVSDGVTPIESAHNHRLYVWQDFGTGGDQINWSIDEQDLQSGAWIFMRGDEGVFEWAKASMDWALRVVLASLKWEVPIATD